MTTAFLSGSVWMIAMRWGRRLIGLVSTVVLARLLTPQDFGIVAMAATVASLLEMLAWTGVDLALIRDSSATREHYDTAWSLKILQGFLVAVLIAGAAPLAAYWFDEPRVASAMLVLALRPIVEGFQNIGVVAFRKELDFGKEFRFGLYQKLISFAVVIVLAVTIGNYWVLIFGLLAEAVAGVAISYWMHPYRPRLSLVRLSDIWSFSKWLLLSRIGFFLNQNVDKFVVGVLSGTATMGSYHVAKEVATMFCNELVFPVRRALFPNLSALASSEQQFRRVTLQLIGIIGIMALPVGFGMSAVADSFVAVVLGQQWTSAVPLIRWLALFGAVVALAISAEVVLPVKGRSDLSAVEAWAQLLVAAPAMVWAGNASSTEGMAMVRFLVALAFLPVTLVLVSRVTRVATADLLTALWRPTVAAVSMWIVVTQVTVSAIPAIQLLVSVVVGGVAYCLALLLLWQLSGRPPSAEAVLVGRLRGAGGQA
jgi:lipopolysaccharide exporter